MKGHSLPGPNQRQSPAKIAPLVMMGAQMLGKKMMEKKAEKDSPATQTKFPNSPGAKERKKKKFIKNHIIPTKKWRGAEAVSEGASEAVTQAQVNKLKKKSPAKGWLSDTVKKGASKVKKHLKGKWDKTTQVGMGLKAVAAKSFKGRKATSGLYGSEPSFPRPDKTFKKAYNKEKKADELAAKRKANK